MTDDALATHLEFLAARLRNGCGNGGCVVKRPTGMHTNGSCNCQPIKYASQFIGLAIECERMGMKWETKEQHE